MIKLAGVILLGSIVKGCVRRVNEDDIGFGIIFPQFHSNKVEIHSLTTSSGIFFNPRNPQIWV